ncbi:Scarecrow-like transcription factor PAT1-like protein [Drosera capensis]
MSNGLYLRPKQEVETCFMPWLQTINPQLQFGVIDHENHFSVTSLPRYCTLESSPATGSYDAQDSPTMTCFSTNVIHESQKISPLSLPSGQHYSPEDLNRSCVTEDRYELKHKLKELETVMLGPDSDKNDSYGNGFLIDPHATSPDSWIHIMDIIESRDLKQVLIACAEVMSDGDKWTTQWLLEELRQLVSVSGEPIQRLGAYILEGLVARLSSSGSSICKALKSKEPSCADLLSYLHILYEVCPYIKFGYMAANGAIAEAMKDESRVHIIDFQIGQGSQWVTLIQAFAARPGGPPHIRITGIDDTLSAYAREGGLSIVGRRLSKLAESFKVPFEFHAVPMSSSEVQRGNLGVRPGEALAANFAFSLHHLHDESVSTENNRDRVLRLVRGLSPKLVTVIEQECNTNTAAFYPRFIETLDYYTAMFESLDVTLLRDQRDRIDVELHCLAGDIVNLIACEGAERVERHELHGKWKQRLTLAGFSPSPLSALVNSTIKTLLEGYSEKYRLEERDGVLYLGWMARDLVAASAWKCS